jgi:hypothetical protein
MTTKMRWEQEPTCVIPREELVRLLSLSRLSHPRLRSAMHELPDGMHHRDDFCGEDYASVLVAVGERRDDPAPAPAGSGTALPSQAHLATTLVTIALTLGAGVMFGMLIL